MTEEKEATPPKSNAWIYFALITGLCYGLGNTIFGQGCSQLGFWGGSFTGPTILLLTSLYRLVDACCNKKRNRTFIDWERSNYWRREET